MAIRTLYLLRHGHYDLDAEPPDGLGGGLTVLGRRQARRVARRLSRLPIEAVHYSSLRRASETARIVSFELRGVPVRSARVLWECIPALDDITAPVFADESAESLARDAAQAERAFMRYARPSRTERHELVVSHGNLIRYFVARALGASGALWINMDIHQCGISIIQIAEGGRMQVLAHNDTGHLPPNMLTFR